MPTIPLSQDSLLSLVFQYVLAFPSILFFPRTNVSADTYNHKSTTQIKQHLDQRSDNDQLTPLPDMREKRLQAFVPEKGPHVVLRQARSVGPPQLAMRLVRERGEGCHQEEEK